MQWSFAATSPQPPEVGRRNEVAHIRWYTLRGGKIVQQWATRDDLGMMQQLDLSPSSKRANPH